LAPLWIRPEKRESGISRFNMDLSGDSLAKRSEDGSKTKIGKVKIILYSE